MSWSVANDLKVEYLSVDGLKAYPGNARRHPKKQVAKLAQQIDKIGWLTPIIADENGMILSGHGRLEAARVLSLKVVPVITVRGLSEADKRSHILADNRLGDESSFSKQMLKVELQSLFEVGANLDLTGFDSLEIDTILTVGEQPARDDDNVALPSDKAAAVSRAGDLWHVGKHRVLCGDAREMTSYERLLGAERAQLIFTDPPYNTPIAGNVSGLGRVKHDDFLMGVGEMSMPEFAQTFLRPAYRGMLAHAQPGAIAFVCTDWKAAPYMVDAANGIFHELKNWIVWVKTNAGMGSWYRSGHEFVLAFKVSPGKHINNFGLGESGRHRSNVWTYPGANTFRAGRMQDLAAHSTVKPKAMVADAIVDCSTRGSIVLDAYLGSGTTAIACEMTGRRCRGIELDPKYVDVILQRLEKETGCEPLLDGITPFSEIAAQRQIEGRADRG